MLTIKTFDDPGGDVEAPEDCKFILVDDDENGIIIDYSDDINELVCRYPQAQIRG